MNRLKSRMQPLMLNDMSIDGINPSQPRQPVIQAREPAGAPERPAFAAPVVSKTKRPVGKLFLRAAVVLFLLVLFAGAAYGGYYWERGRAVTVENNLRASIAALQ